MVNKDEYITIERAKVSVWQRQQECRVTSQVQTATSMTRECHISHDAFSNLHAKHIRHQLLKHGRSVLLWGRPGSSVRGPRFPTKV